MKPAFAFLVGCFLLGLLLAAPSEKAFISPTEYTGAGGKYRWSVKVEEDQPGDATAITSKEIADWDDLDGIKTDSPRQGKESEWYSIRGKVVLAKFEADGDIHVGITDDDGAGVQTVIEIPAGKPWDDIRKEVCSWADITFPCKEHKFKLTKSPIIQATGRAFWDGEHHGKTPNRRSYDDNITVWEIHPCMKLEVIK